MISSALLLARKFFGRRIANPLPLQAFIYVDYSQEFPFITPELLKIFEENCDFEDDDLKPYERFLLEIKDKQNLVIFNMIDTESSIMIRVGIDMNFCGEEQD